MYDDDDDNYNGTNDYAYGDPLNMNDSSNQLQFTQCFKTVQFQKCLKGKQQAAPQATTTNTSKHEQTRNNKTNKQRSAVHI